MGRKALPIYRIVVMDSRKKRDGAYIKLIGTYNPIKKDVKINTEVYKKYINNGAQPTETVERLFKSYGNQ